jgi:hypothetical protein
MGKRQDVRQLQAEQKLRIQEGRFTDTVQGTASGAASTGMTGRAAKPQATRPSAQVTAEAESGELPITT